MRVADNTVGALLDLYRSELTVLHGQREAIAIARMVFKETLGWDVFQLEDRKKLPLSESELLRAYSPLVRLRNGEPLQYVLGQIHFSGLTLKVDGRVLIPRPETEELVDHITKQGRSFRRIVDVGTGSGCIALALKRAFPEARVIGMDRSTDALAVARMNGDLNKLDVEWEQCDVLSTTSSFPHGCDLIVSNPPYIPRNEETSLAENVRAHEPHLALFVDARDPVLFYRRIGEMAWSAVVDGGELWFEGHHIHVREAATVMQDLGYRDVAVLGDLSGSDRFIRAVR